MDISAFSLQSLSAYCLSYAYTPWATDVVFAILCGVVIYFLILPYLPFAPSEPQPRRGKRSRKSIKMDISAFSLQSLSAYCLSYSYTPWATDVVFAILCGVVIYFLILPYLPFAPSEPQPRRGKRSRKHGKEQRTRNKSTMTVGTVGASRDRLQERNETRNPIYLLHSNLRKGPDKTEYRQLLYESSRTKHTREHLIKYHENGESSQLCGQHNNTTPFRTHLQNDYNNDKSTQLWDQNINTGPAGADMSGNHQDARAGTADAAPAVPLSDVSNPGDLPLLTSTQSSECQAQSELGSLSNDPSTKYFGKSLLPALSLLEFLIWLLSQLLWLWASTFYSFIAVTARYKSSQKPKAQSGNAQHDTTIHLPLGNIKDKEHLLFKKYSSPKNGHIIQTHWSVCILWEHLENILQTHLTKKKNQIKNGLFPVRVRRSWVTVLCNYNAPVKTRNIPPFKGRRVHQAHQREQVKTTSAIMPGSPLTVRSPEREETTKALGRTTTEVYQHPSKALGTEKGSRMSSQTIPSRVQARPWQGERGLSVRRGNHQGSLSFISEPKESAGPAPADHAQKVAVLQKNLENKSLRGKKAMNEVDMEEATTVMVTTENTKQVKSKNGPAWDVLLGPSVKARSQTADLNLTPFSSTFKNVTAQDPNEPYLATKVANQFKLKANGDSDSQCQAVKLIPKEPHTEVLLQDIATGMLTQDTCNKVLLQDSQTDVPLAANILACQRAQSDPPEKQRRGNIIQRFLDYIFHGKRSQKKQEPSIQKGENQDNSGSQKPKPTDTQSDVSIVVREDNTTHMDKKSKTIPTRLTETLFTSLYVKKDSATFERTIWKSEVMEKGESTVCERDVAMFDKRNDDRRAQADSKTEFPQWKDSPTSKKSSTLLMGQREDIFRRKSSQLMPENEPEIMGGHMRERMGHSPHYLNFSKTGQGSKYLGKNISSASVISQSQVSIQSRQIENKEMLAAHKITTVVEQILVDKLGLQHRVSASGANLQNQKLQAPPGTSSSSQRNLTYLEQKHLRRDMPYYERIPSLTQITDQLQNKSDMWSYHPMW